MEQLTSEVEAYVRDFPYQETYKYLTTFTQGDATRLNTMLLPPDPFLLKAGDDKIVRSNNDTFYNIAFHSLAQGSVVLRADAPAGDRFVSFQLMDDHNVNFSNLIHPAGTYTLYRGSVPVEAEGELVESPSEVGVVVVRVEVRDKLARRCRWSAVDRRRRSLHAHDRRSTGRRFLVGDGVRLGTRRVLASELRRPNRQ